MQTNEHNCQHSLPHWSVCSGVNSAQWNDLMSVKSNCVFPRVLIIYNTSLCLFDLFTRLA